MNNNRSVWSPISPSTTTAVDDYNSAVDHHRLQPMTTSTSNINPFQFGPLSTDYDSNLLQNGSELIQGQNSSFNSVYHNIGGFNNSSLINTSNAGINSYTTNSHSTVALNYSDQQKNQQSFQPSETLFRSPNFVTTPMGYPYGSDPSYLYNSQNFSSIFDTLQFSEGAILDSVARYTTAPGTLFQSPITPYFTNPMAPNPPKRRTGGRRPKEEEQKLPPEEEEKRRQRRLRNKEAAARCRKRRLDQMTTFEIKVDELQNNQNRLEAELDRLMQEKNDLEFILRAHESVCQRRDMKPFSMLVSMSPTGIKTEVHETDPEEATVEDKLADASTDQSLTLSVVNKLKRSMDSDYLARPTILPLSRALNSLSSGSSFENETPSRELFPYLLNQPTGLTPSTNSSGLTPFLFRTTSGSSSMLPLVDTPSISESKIGSSNLTKL